MIKHLTLVALIAVLAGCSVGPNYQPPKTKVPDTFSSTQLVSGADLSRWWTSFDDSVLNSLIERAVKGNPDLKLAQARVREARAQRGVARADQLPTVEVTGSYQRSGTSGDGEQPFLFEGDLYEASFDASWEIDIFGGVRRAVEAANADLQAEIENRRDVLVSLLAEVARNYIELRAAQRQIAIATANLEAQQETLELTRVRFEAGLVSALDVARAEAQVETTASQIPSLEITVQQSAHLLAVLLGLEPRALLPELAEPKLLPAAPLLVPTGLPSELLRRRPDVRRAEREIAAATARIGVATADLFPRFSLTAALGLQSSKLSTLDDSRFWTFIPGVRWPIFDFGRIRNNIAVQNAREQQAVTNYERTVLTSLQDVEDALVALSENRKRRETLANAVTANQKAVELARQLYEQGLTDFLDVLQVQRDLFTSQDALILSDRNLSSDLVALYKALGGGWEIEKSAIDAPPAGKPGNRTVDVTKVKGKS